MPVEPVDLLIEARWVLPIAPANIVLPDHAVAISAGKIVALGPSERLAASFRAEERIVRPRHALLPGFVNAHTRSDLTLLRGAPVRGPRERWRREILAPLEAERLEARSARFATELAIAEMLQAGITAFADECAFPEETARAAAAAHVRVSVGLPFGRPPAEGESDSGAAELAAAERLWDAYRSDPWVSFHFAPGEADEVSDEAWMRLRRIADELDARVTARFPNTRAHVAQSVARHGKPPLERLRELGLLRPGFTAIGLNCMTEGDVDTLAATGLDVVGCPVSDLRLGEGSCPVTRLLDQHIGVALGTGDPVSAGALDILEQARLALLAERASAGESSQLASLDVLELATLAGARALGIGAHGGSLEPGKSADLVCVDLGSLACGAATPAEALVFGATRRDVSDVWTSGRAAVSGGHLLTFDAAALAAGARAWARPQTSGDSP